MTTPRPLTPGFSPFSPSRLTRIRAMREMDIFHAETLNPPRRVRVGGSTPKPRKPKYDTSILAGLPPEQRALVEKVLARK